jgi:type 2A phosphatase activator TIP41
MLFGHNSLQIKHRHTGWTYAFRVEDALRGVKSSPLEDGDGGIKVAMRMLGSRVGEYRTFRPHR